MKNLTSPIILVGITASLLSKSLGFIPSSIRTSYHTASISIKCRNKLRTTKATSSPLFAQQALSEPDGKDQINAEIEQALEEAEEALSLFMEDKDKVNEVRQRAIQAQQQVKQLAQKKARTTNQVNPVEGVVAGIGGVLFGFVSGGVMDIFLRTNNFHLNNVSQQVICCCFQKLLT